VNRPAVVRCAGLLAAAVLAAGAYLVGASGLLEPAAGRSSNEVSQTGPVTVRIPAVTRRRQAVRATGGEIVRVELAVSDTTSWRRVQMRHPSWLQPVGDELTLVSADDGSRKPYGTIADLLAGELRVSGTGSGHLRVDLEVTARDEESGDPDLADLVIDLDGTPIELDVARDEQMLGPDGARYTVDPWPARSERTDLMRWSEDAEPERASLNRWTTAIVGDSIEHVIDDWTRFVRIKDQASPGGGRWLTDAYVYPGDRLNVAISYFNGAWPKPDAGPELDEPSAEQVDPAYARDVRVSLNIPAHAATTHHLGGRISAANTDPRSIGHVATASADRPVLLVARRDRTSYAGHSVPEVNDSWLTTHPAEAVAHLGALVGNSYENVDGAFWGPGRRGSWTVVVDVMLEAPEREGSG
jgi:hypothetical protein